MALTLGNYTLLQQLSQQSFPLIYKALDNTNHEFRTIYIFNLSTQPTTLSNQLENIKIMMPLLRMSKSIIRFIQSFINQQRRYIVYEYCNEGKLRQILSQNVLTQFMIIDYFKQILQIFVFLRKFKIFHNNITSENIYIHNGKIKLGGFEYCKFQEDSQNLDLQLYSKHRMDYLAPQILIQKKYNQKSDIWALGIVLYQMIYQQCPSSQDIQHLQQLHLQQQRKNNSLNSLLAKMLHNHKERISWQQLFEVNFNENKTQQRSVYQTLWEQQQSARGSQKMKQVKQSVETQKFCDENDQIIKKASIENELFQRIKQSTIFDSIIHFQHTSEIKPKQKLFSHFPECIWEVNSFSSQKQSPTSFILEKSMCELIKSQIEAADDFDRDHSVNEHVKYQNIQDKIQDEKQYEKQWYSQANKNRITQHTSNIRQKINDLFDMSFDSN